jgi:hypothetical protein
MAGKAACHQQLLILRQDHASGKSGSPATERRTRVSTLLWSAAILRLSSQEKAHKSEAAGGIWPCLQSQREIAHQGLGNEAFPLLLGPGATRWTMESSRRFNPLGRSAPDPWERMPWQGRAAMQGWPTSAHGLPSSGDTSMFLFGTGNFAPMPGDASYAHLPTFWA